MKLDVVRLTDMETKLAYMIGEQRHLTKAKDLRAGDPGTSRRDETIGSSGEIAFARWMQIYPNLGVYVEPGSPDYVIDNVTIDIKSTHDPRRLNNLVVPIHKAERGRCDLYVLVSVDGNVCQLAGFTFSTIVFNGLVKDLGWGESYFVERRYLRPMAEIRGAIVELSDNHRLTTIRIPRTI